MLDKHCYIMETPLRSFARQPTPSEDIESHGGGQNLQEMSADNVQSSMGIFSHLTPYSPFTMDSGQISTTREVERYVQPGEVFLPSAAATEQALRDFINIPQSRPLNLSSLKDITSPTKIPNLTHLAALAIWASPSKRLTLSEIYDAIEARYPILKGHKEKKWKESLRHRLSFKSVFVRVGRSEKGRRGGYWALDVSKGLNENKRPRKQRPSDALTPHMTASGTLILPLSDRDDQGASDYSDYSHHSSASMSPHAAPDALSVGPIPDYLSYHLPEANMPTHHESPSSELPEITQTPYGSGNLMLHGVESVGYSTSQASTSYYATGHQTLEYDRYHSPAPPSLNISEQFFSTNAQDSEAGFQSMNVDSTTNRTQHDSPEYDAADDF